MTKEKIIEIHNTNASLIRYEFENLGLKTLDLNVLDEETARIAYDQLIEFNDDSLISNVNQWYKSRIIKYRKEDGTYIEFKKFLESEREVEKKKKSYHYGDFMLDHTLYGKETTIKVAGSNLISTKTIKSFWGKFIVVINKENILQSKMFKKNTLEAYVNKADTSKTNAQIDIGYLIDLNKLKNYCTIEDYKVYYTQRVLCDAENNNEVAHELELTFFNKYKGIQK